MQSSTTDEPFHPRCSGQIRPALTSFADEVSATVARLFAYVGVLALFGILGLQAWNQLQLEWIDEQGVTTGWSAAERASPGFALSRQGTSGKPAKSETYLVLRHPSGGRKDILRWSGPGGKPLAELEIYRPGGEYGSATAARAELADRMRAPGSGPEGAGFESAGVIESKFGNVALLRLVGARDSAMSCLGFVKRIDDPTLQMSGWSCQGDSLPARRAGIECMLNRVVSLAGNEPKLAQLFAGAEPQAPNCPSGTVAADWITSAAVPPLRGSL